MSIIEAVRWAPDGAVRIIDQRRLPTDYVERDLRTLDEVCDAIRTLAVRGAPAIGVAGAMGLVASLAERGAHGTDAFWGDVERHALAIRATRPTAVNLPCAIDRMRAVARTLCEQETAPGDALDRLRAEATAILE